MEQENKGAEKNKSGLEEYMDKDMSEIIIWTHENDSDDEGEDNYPGESSTQWT